jgi:ribosome-associated translation inhibitor RaiA
MKRRRLHDENEYTHTLNKEESLEHVLSKLNKFSKSIQDQRIGKDAKKIAQRIALALNAVKQQAGLTKFSTRWSDMDTNHDEDDFDNIGNCLIVAKRVDINTGIRRTRHTKLTRVVRKCDKVTFGQWEISLRTSILEFRNEDGTDIVESLSSLYLDPRSSDASVPLTIHFGETTIHSAVSFINPVILAYRVISDDSEVFKMIKKDDFEGLIKLLADGKATLRDCDDAGGTLLHVSECSKHHWYPS